MPIIKSITLGTCPGDTASGSATGRLVQNVYDAGGSGTLTWTKNSGVVPTDVENNFTVHHNGRQLEYPAEYTVTQNVGDATVQISPTVAFPGAYYILTGYF